MTWASILSASILLSTDCCSEKIRGREGVREMTSSVQLPRETQTRDHPKKLKGPCVGLCRKLFVRNMASRIPLRGVSPRLTATPRLLGAPGSHSAPYRPIASSSRLRSAASGPRRALRRLDPQRPSRRWASAAALAVEEPETSQEPEWPPVILPELSETDKRRLRRQRNVGM